MIASFVFLRGFLIRGFVAESVESSAASAILDTRRSGFRLYDDLSPLRLVRVEAGTSSFRSAKQQTTTSTWIRHHRRQQSGFTQCESHCDCEQKLHPHRIAQQILVEGLFHSYQRMWPAFNQQRVSHVITPSFAWRSKNSFNACSNSGKRESPIRGACDRESAIPRRCCQSIRSSPPRS